MAAIESSNFYENEILKSMDVNNGFSSQINNFGKLLQTLIESRQDFVIGESEIVKPHSNQEDDWTITISPLLGVSKTTGDMVLETETLNAGITAPIGGVSRVDVIEIKGEISGTEESQRAFIDFDSKTTTIKKVDIKKILQVKVQSISNPVIGSIEPPVHSEGWIKIAEIEIPGDATKISDCIIHNITSNEYNVENPEWKLETKATYNLGYMSGINEKLSSILNRDGSIKTEVIKKPNIDFGIQTNQVNSKVIPVGQEIELSEEIKIAATSSIVEAINSITTYIDTKGSKIKIEDDQTSITDDSTFISMEVGEEVEQGKSHPISKLIDYIKTQLASTFANKNNKITVTAKTEDLTDEDIFTSISAGENPESADNHTLSDLTDYMKTSLEDTFGKIETPLLTPAQYEALTEEEKMDGKLRGVKAVNPTDVQFNQINDNITTTENTWSSDKINGALTDYINETKTQKKLTQPSVNANFEMKRSGAFLLINYDWDNPSVWLVIHTDTANLVIVLKDGAASSNNYISISVDKSSITASYTPISGGSYIYFNPIY